MLYVEFEGKTVDQAIENACNELNIKKSTLKYDVLSYGSTGIFGLVGIKKARIRVAAPKNESPAIFKSDEKDKDNDLNEIPADDNISDLKKELDDIKSSASKDVKIIEAKADEIISDKNMIEVQNETSTEAAEEQFYNLADESEEDELLDEEDETDALQEDMADISQNGFDVLKRIVEAITTGASVAMEVKKSRILFNVDGGNSGILIGKHGQTLDAMQYLVDKVVNKKRRRQRIRVRIDVEGYLKAREENLNKLAERMGEKVKSSGRSVTMNPMSAHDRRIIHLALKNDPKVRTQSMGSGYYRKLVIFPQRKGKSANNKSKKSV
jgi:spoIIIJ-associated protein